MKLSYENEDMKKALFIRGVLAIHRRFPSALYYIRPEGGEKSELKNCQIILLV